MNRYIIGSLWDRSNRNGANKNFEYLFEGRWKIDELNVKADGVLNEAKKTNDMNKAVQNQLDNLIIESGNANAEVSQARGGLPLLKDRLDKSDSQLAQSTQDYINLGKQNEGGQADNYNDLVALVNLAKSENKGLYIPNGKFYVSDDLEIDMIRNIKIDGEIIMAEGKTLTLLYDSRRSFSCNWHVNFVNGKVRLMGLKNANVVVQYARELELYALSGETGETTGSIAYSNFWLGTINTFKITGEQAGGTGLPWINENTFYGGRIKNFYMDGTYSHNNNTFYKPMLEGSNIHIEVGGSNTFYDVRFEGENNITFGEEAYDNVFVKSWQPFKGFYLRQASEVGYSVVDNGVGNMVVNNLDVYYDSKEVFSLNPRSNNFDLDLFIKKKNALNFVRGIRTFFESGMIELKHDIGINGISDIPFTRAHIQFYDENKNLITNDMTKHFSALSMSWNSVDSTLRNTSTVQLIQATIFKNSPIRYFTIRIEAYNASIDFQYFRLVLKSPKRSVISIPDSTKYKSYNYYRKPTRGYWEVGDIVKNNTPTQGSYIGWVCTQEGEFDTDNEPVFEGYGLIGE